MKNDCNKCTTDLKLKQSDKASFLSTLFIVLIPKCPLCIMAYSSAITMCGGRELYLNQNNWVSYIPIILGVVILVLIIQRFKGLKTWVSLMIATGGLLLIVGVHQLMIPSSAYNLGAGLLLFATWLNGSFISFVNHLKKFVKTKEVAWHT